VKQLAAFSILSMRPKPTLPDEDDESWKSSKYIPFTRKFIRLNADRIPQIAFRARLPFLFLGVGLVFAMGFWGRRLFGSGPAILATTVTALSPNLLAHSKLATTDLAGSTFIFLSVGTFWWASRTFGLRRWVVCGFVTGLALITKFTALLLGPIYFILAILLVAGGGVGEQTRVQLTRSLLLGLTVVGIVAAVIVGAGYNFSFNYSLYLNGLKQIYSLGRPDYIFYLFGQTSTEPWWYYNIAALLVKLPLPTLSLLALATFSFSRNRERGSREAGLVLLVPAAVILIASFFNQANIGVRHVLPALPFLFLFTALAWPRRPHRFLRLLVVLLVLWTAVEAARIYPHHLAYFSSAVGGPNRGPYLLDDSNIDWGQDLPALEEWQRAHPDARPFRLLYFGNVPPDIYGVEAESMERQDIITPRPGTYAISAHQLVWFRKLQAKAETDIDWLTRYRPIARAGHSIYIYRFP
jgi:4-amino-4-deoxy-L-arabinose transferase-like glycosyltransferase